MSNQKKTLEQWFQAQSLLNAGVAKGEKYITLKGARALLEAYIRGEIEV